MKNYEIWMEGYRATGESGTAQLIAIYEGESFDDAVMNYMEKTPNHGIAKNTRNGYISDKAYENRESNWNIWSCNLFDNETDARKSFG